MELIWSTATFKAVEIHDFIGIVGLVFQNAMWYWNPEQPPPTTATRSATGTGVLHGHDFLHFYGGGNRGSD